MFETLKLELTFIVLPSFVYLVSLILFGTETYIMHKKKVIIQDYGVHVIADFLAPALIMIHHVRTYQERQPSATILDDNAKYYRLTKNEELELDQQVSSLSTFGPQSEAL
jgi:hypothetical protein